MYSKRKSKFAVRMKRISLLIGFALFIPAFLSAETNSQINDIQKKLKKSEGEQRIKLLIELSKAYSTISYFQCTKYGEQSIREAENLGNNSLAGLASKDLGVSSYYTCNYKDALKYFKRGLKFYRKAKDKKGISNCVNDMGLVYENWSEFDTAAYYYKQSLDIEVELKNKQGIATSLINIGNINYYRKAYYRSLKSYMKALNNFMEVQDYIGMAKAYNSIGIIYEQLNEYDKAIHYLQKSKYIYENKKKDLWELSKVLNNLGDVYNDCLKDYKKALMLYEQTLELKKQINDKAGLATVKCNLGTLYGKTGNFPKALKLLKESEQEFQQISKKSGIVMVYYNMGEVFLSARNFKEALKYFKKGTRLAKQIGYTDYYQEFNEGFFFCYAGLGDFANFNRYYSIYSQNQDSLIKKLQLDQTSEIENQFEVKELSQKSEALKEKSQSQSRQIKNFDLIFAILAGVLVFLLVSALFYLKIRKKVRVLKNEEL